MEVNAAAASEQAMTLHDQDKNGELSKEELKSLPAILRSLEQFDKDSSGSVSKSEIQARIEQWQSLKVAMMSCSFTVSLDGKPLIDATVELTPEKMMGASLPKSIGTTDATGRVTPTMVASDSMEAGAEVLSGIPPGLYKVSIQHAKLKSLSRYNSATELGLQVAPDDPSLLMTEFALKSSK